jgi:hypothetical protein
MKIAVHCHHELAFGSNAIVAYWLDGATLNGWAHIHKEQTVIDNENSEWRTGDLEGKSWSVYRWKHNHVIHLMNKANKIKRFRSRQTADRAAFELNQKYQVDSTDI